MNPMNSNQPDLSVPFARRRQPPFHSQPQSNAGFTVIELLAVLVVLGLMASMLVSTAAATRPNASSFQCANNLRRLVAAWTMYADDNRGQLVYNTDGANSGKAAGTESWAGGWLTLDYEQVNNTDNTNVFLLMDHTRYPYGAYLGSYVKTPSAFKCPADKAVVTMAGQRFPRVRSVSMNSFMGQKARTWTSGSRFNLYTKTAQLSAPSKLFVFLDEREDSLNDSLFWTNPDTRYNLIDFPACYHNRAGAFGFADGHTEIHRWRDPRTMPPLVPGVPLPLNVNLPVDLDVDWLQQHASLPRSGF